MRYLKIFSLCVVALALTTCSFNNAEAFMDYDVEWSTSDGKKQTSTLTITIDNCETKITMKNSDIEAFKNNFSIMNDVVASAIRRAKNGCKN